MHETTIYEMDYCKRMKARLIEMRLKKKQKKDSLKGSRVERFRERYSLGVLGVGTPPVRHKSEVMPVTNSSNVAWHQKHEQ